VLVAVSLGAIATGCGSSSPTTSTSTAAAVAGELDTHCTMNDEEIKAPLGMCMTGGGSASAPDAAPADHDGGAGGAGGSDFGATLFNAEGDDDDCKYHVKWTSTAVKENVGVTFEVNVVRRIDGKPAMGADVQIEAFLNAVHPTPSTNIKNAESSGANYSIGPVVFDAPGRWTVRFHFYETCSDVPSDSPHGHAAFYVDVP
jgi:hypothetical protein